MLWINHLPRIPEKKKQCQQCCSSGGSEEGNEDDDEAGAAGRRSEQRASKPVVESYRDAGFVVGTSASPSGPFAFAATMEGARPAMAYAGGADFSLMHDVGTGDAYIA